MALYPPVYPSAATVPSDTVDARHRIQRIRGAASPTVGAQARHRIQRIRGSASPAQTTTPVVAALTAPLTVDAYQVFTLDASASTGATKWVFTQTAGQAVVLSGTGATRTAAAPVLRDGGTLTFSVAVSAVGSGDSIATVSVDVGAPQRYIVQTDGSLLAVEQYLI